MFTQYYQHHHHQCGGGCTDEWAPLRSSRMECHCVAWRCAWRGKSKLFHVFCWPFSQSFLKMFARHGLWSQRRVFPLTTTSLKLMIGGCTDGWARLSTMGCIVLPDGMWRQAPPFLYHLEHFFKHGHRHKPQHIVSKSINSKTLVVICDDSIWIT